MATATINRGSVLTVPLTVPGLVKGFLSLTKKKRALAFVRIARVIVGK